MRLRFLTAASMVVATLFAPAMANASGPLHAFSTLDYAHAKTAPGMTFLPLLASDASFEEGIAFYTSYFNDVQAPVVWSPTLRSLEVFVTPSVHKGDAAAYNAFFDGTTLVDKQEWWFASESPCSLSPALARFTQGLAPELQPTVSTGGYPTVCNVTLYYRTAQEGELLALLNANQGIAVNDTLPFCTASSPVFYTQAVANKVVALGAVSDDGSGVLTGAFADVLHAVHQIKKSLPVLLGGTTASANGEASFLRDAFDVTGAKATLLDSMTEPQSRMTACTPAPFSVHYGN